MRLLVVALIHNGLDLHGQAQQVDEALRILVAVQILGVAEGGDLFQVQAVGGLHAGVDAVALVELELHGAVDGLLGGIHEGGQRLAQGGKPLTVIEKFCKSDGKFERCKYGDHGAYY